MSRIEHYFILTAISATQIQWVYWIIMIMIMIIIIIIIIVVENGGKHPCSSASLLYLSRDKGGRGLCSIEPEYKETKVKAAVESGSESVSEQRSGNEDGTGLWGVCGDCGAPSTDNRSSGVHEGVWFAAYSLNTLIQSVSQRSERWYLEKKIKNLLKRHRESRVQVEVR